MPLSDFIAMGGYGAYVWSAFGFAAITMVGLLWQSFWMSRKRAIELDELRKQLRPKSAAKRSSGPLRPRRADSES